VLHDEEALNYELPDAALELAASKCSELAGNPFTCILHGIRHLPRLVE